MLNKTQLTDDLNFTSKTITTDVIDEYGNSIVSSKRIKTHRHSGRYCIKLLKITIKNIGLTLLLIGYLCSGGYIFRSLELYNEAQDCYQRQKTFNDKLNSTTLRIIGTMKSLNTEQIDNTQTINDIIMTLLNNYADELYALDIKQSKNCSTILNTLDGSKWNLVNSIFFCVTVITTIGYGHIAPVTFWGRITCIIYAIIGIPLMLIYLAIIGNLLARGFRIIFLNLFCCRCFYDILKRKREQRRQRLREWEESLHEHEEEEAKRRGLPLPPKKIQFYNDDDDDDDDGDYLEIDDEDENIEGAKLHVPLTVSVIVLSIYTLFGAMLFPTWEDWSIADAAYFSFTTIATIGFGDLVPGNGRFTEGKTQTELLIGGLYLLFGLALLSMCLNLMKDEIVAKVHYICQCIGVKNKINKQNDENTTTNTTDNNTTTNKQQFIIHTINKQKQLPLNNKQLDNETKQLMKTSKTTTTTTTTATTNDNNSSNDNKYENNQHQYENQTFQGDG
ncbi:hypothetical protein MN116_005631 [Schistosoma mekongi]|uniref:Potassium channel domain-containing protein n=1 Tax=Schistosoma mekongi TaxID=38744 RepID=A0AAE1ZAJ4_SCHME|nr:hypothetical protein MN116_005631 [Schistosoma mekongi]